ncbi:MULTISPECIES: transposase [Nostocales]|uniref:transposase n=1 Tax=Nostocales TaxID=1161 RepID=UPI0004BCB9CE|nr:MULTISPECIES: transposase [Nostocales]
MSSPKPDFQPQSESDQLPAIAQPDFQPQDELDHIFIGYETVIAGGTQKVTLRSGKSYEVKIPANSPEGAKLPLKGCGLQGNDVGVMTGGAAIIAAGAGFAAYKFFKGDKNDPKRILKKLEAKLYSTISELMQKAKGSSSHLITHEIKPHEFFKWQGGYGAFTVSNQFIDQVDDYIRNQATHYNQKSLISDWEII